MTVGNLGGYQRGPARAHDIRRLRDLLRFAVLSGGYPDGQLPSESELMAAYGVSRATVREALAQLRADGLIQRTQGVGTNVTTIAVTTLMAEAHGIVTPSQDCMLSSGRVWSRVLDQSVIPTPPTVSSGLGVGAGTSCLRLDYVGMFDDEPVSLATNYVLFPEAEMLLGCPFRSDWYQFMAECGVEFGTSEFVLGCELADATVAAELWVPEGTPVTWVEQKISDPAGRPFDLALAYILGRRFRIESRGLRNPRGVDEVE